MPNSPLLPIRDFTIDLPDYLENCSGVSTTSASITDKSPCLTSTLGKRLFNTSVEIPDCDSQTTLNFRKLIMIKTGKFKRNLRQMEAKRLCTDY